MLIAHLSDLHIKEAADVIGLERQLDRIVVRRPDHLAITGDLLDRWSPPLLARILDALDARGLLEPGRTTILHGNHDLASSGGHPSGRGDLWRLGLRFWDPPPLLRARRRRFRQSISRRVPDVVARTPCMKMLASGARIATLDTVPFFWKPFTFSAGRIALTQAIGTIPADQCAWLAAQPRTATPLIVLMHHYPLGAPSFQWAPRPPLPPVVVPMDVPSAEQALFWSAAGTAGVRLVLCGHVHRSRLDWHDGIAVGLNGQSGAAWAGRTVAWYEVSEDQVTRTEERTTERVGDTRVQ